MHLFLLRLGYKAKGKRTLVENISCLAETKHWNILMNIGHKHWCFPELFVTSLCDKDDVFQEDYGAGHG